MSLDQFLKEYEQENTSRWTSLRRGVGKALVGAALMGLAATGVKAQEPGQYAPFVDHDTTITAFNPTDKPMTVTASYGLIGIDPRNGAQVTVDIPPHATVAIPNALPSDPYHPEGSAYIQASGDDAPVLTASTEHTDGTGMNIPILPYDAKNNLQPQAGILQTGIEKEVFLSGDSTSTNTTWREAWVPTGGQPTISEHFYAPSNIITSGQVNDALHLRFPPNSSYFLIPQAADESKAAGLLLYTNPASGDTRLRPMQNFSTTQPTVYDFCNFWFPTGNFYGRVTEAYGILNDSQDVLDISTILVRSPDNTNGTTVDQMEAWLRSYVDGDPSNGEITNIHDPVEINTTSYILFVNNGGIAEIHLNPSDIQAMRDLYRTQALPGYVDGHKPEYNCQGLDAIDMTCPPHWDTLNQTTSSSVKWSQSSTSPLNYSTPPVSTVFDK